MFDVIQHFIHPDLRHSYHVDYRKARLAAYSFILFFLFFLPYIIYFYIKYPEDKVKLLTNFLGIPFFVIIFLVLRFSRQFNTSMGILNLFSYGLILISIYHTGGIYSADIAWFVLTIVSAFFVMGNLWGIISTSTAGLGVIFIFYLDTKNTQRIIFKNYIQEHDSTHYLFTWVFVLVLLGVLLYSINKVIEKINFKINILHHENINKLEIRIKEKTDEIAQLRSNLAKDFHDEMGNKLASINILSQSIAYQLKDQQPDLLISLETIEKRSRELYQGTKDFIWSIDVRSDNIYELFRYTRDFGERFLLPLNLSFTASSSIDENTVRRLNPNTTRQYLFIMKEILTNAAKHSNCNEVNLSFELNSQDLYIIIKDNGIGIPNQKLAQGGIKNIKERIQEIGARLKLTSNSMGTCYELTIPLE